MLLKLIYKKILNMVDDSALKSKRMYHAELYVTRINLATGIDSYTTSKVALSERSASF